MTQNNKYSSLIGKVIDNRYKILEIVGEGGMAVVMKAHDSLMRRTVAIKVLNDEYNSDENAVRRFINESKAVALLSNQNIVNIYDVAFGGDMKYIVMEYVDGITLQEYLDKKGKLPWKEALDFTRQILNALDHAHEKGVVHRDIKPQNVLMLPSGLVKVADFGIARVPSSNTITIKEQAVGTVHYISPEQASGKETNAYSDIYSVGVMLYEMVTGRLPFEGDTPVSTALMQINDKPEDPKTLDPSLPRGLCQIILKAMEKDPSKRFKSAHSMSRALQILSNNPATVFEETKKSSALVKSEVPAAQPEIIEKKGKDGGKEDRKYRMLPIITGSAAGLLFVIVILLSYVAIEFANGGLTIEAVEKWISGGDTRSISDDEIIVENYVNKSLEETLNRLKELGIKVNTNKIEYVYDANYEPGFIVSQVPEADTVKKKEYTEMEFKVSLGQENVILPDVYLYDHREAEIILSELGLKVVTEKRSDEAVVSGYVIETSPAIGSVIAKGDTVTVYVSEGLKVKYTAFPDVIGKPVSEARKVITESKILVGTVTEEPSTDYSAGEVIAVYDSDSGKAVTAGDSMAESFSSVNLVVAVNP